MSTSLPNPDAAAPAAGAAGRGLTLAAVERDTGLSKDTLRSWEHLYGFPAPMQDAAGERHYPPDQVERLRLIKRVLEAGYAPAQALPMTPDELRARCGVDPTNPDRHVTTADARRALVERVAANDVEGLRKGLADALAGLGPGRFVRELAAPLTVDVGDAWMRGELEVFQEHLYTETVQAILRHTQHQLPDAAQHPPRVLLTTASGESHALGLLMAQVVLTLEGCRCVSLGVQTPVWDIVRAAKALGADVVALGHAGGADPALVAETLSELRSKLPHAIELWAGGSAPALRRRAGEGVLVLPTLEQAVQAVAAWRRRHPAAA